MWLKAEILQEYAWGSYRFAAWGLRFAFAYLIVVSFTYPHYAR